MRETHQAASPSTIAVISFLLVAIAQTLSLTGGLDMFTSKFRSYSDSPCTHTHQLRDSKAVVLGVDQLCLLAVRVYVSCAYVFQNCVADLSYTTRAVLYAACHIDAYLLHDTRLP